MSDWPPQPGDAGEHPDGGLFVFPADLPSWREWLEERHDRVRHVWLILPKKGSGLPGISPSDAVDEALCWGWIDSRPGKVDGLRWALTFTPRRPGSDWSAVNRRKVEALRSQDRIAPPGLVAIEAAQRDGSWSRLAASDALELPVDLVRALSASPDAAAGWEALPPSARKPLLAWIQDAKRQATRDDRIRRTVEGALAGRSPLAWPRQEPR